MTQMELFKPDQTISEVKEYIKQHWRTTSGAICPCCDQNVKLYRTKIGASHVVPLITLYKLGPGYHTVRDIHGGEKNQSGEFAKCKHWGLIEQLPKDEKDTHKRTSGVWKITEVGRLFVLRETWVLKYALLYNKKCYGLEGPKVDIVDALGTGFNYKHLMMGI